MILCQWEHLSGSWQKYPEGLLILRICFSPKLLQCLIHIDLWCKWCFQLHAQKYVGLSAHFNKALWCLAHLGNTKLEQEISHDLTNTTTVNKADSFCWLPHCPQEASQYYLWKTCITHQYLPLPDFDWHGNILTNTWAIQFLWLRTVSMFDRFINTKVSMRILIACLFLCYWKAGMYNLKQLSWSLQVTS